MEFGGAALFEARRGIQQLGGAAPWVGHQFGDAIGEFSKKGLEIGGVVAAGERKAGEIIGCAEGAGIDPAREAAHEAIDEFRFERSTVGDLQIGGTAKEGDLKFFGDDTEGAANGREEMGVFVGVSVGGRNAGGLDFVGLGGEFAIEIQFAGVDGADEGREIGWKWFLGKEGMAADEDEMHANVEGGVGEGELNGVIEGIAIGHKGGGGEDALGVGIDNAGVHIAGESEVIGVDDQAFQNSLSWMVRNFLGLARKSFIIRFISFMVPFMES